MKLTLTDNGGRRQEGDRRQLVLENYNPERRSGSDRRAEGDRRKITKSIGWPKERRHIHEFLSA